MGKGKKPFIQRKGAVTFHLVHRSQHDPLITDETAPQRVLLESSTKQAQSQKNEHDFSKRKEEQKKYGIVFDDDYDYLQHLKKPEQEVVWEYVENPNQTRKRVDEGHLTTAPKLILPSSVFASEFEEAEGMLLKAAPTAGPQLQWDPEVLAALDDDFAFDSEENQLEDDFVSKAMGDENDPFIPESESILNNGECRSDLSEDGYSDDEFIDKLAPLLRERFNNEETKSRFTEYSMSSSVMRRTEQLSLLDDRFEQFYATYDDAELGDLVANDIEGTLQQTHPYVLSTANEYKQNQKAIPYNRAWDKKRLKKYRYVDDAETDQSHDLIEVETDDNKSKKWDCESILSTYSNIYNHPKCIDEPSCRQEKKQKKIEIDSKSGIPSGVLRNSDSSKLNVKVLAEFTDGKVENALGAKSVISTLSVLSIRPKDETPEEKRDRKRLLKEYRSERRLERKANTKAFKEEQKRQAESQIHQRNCLQGNKLL